MVRGLMILVLLIVCGCIADIRPAIHATDQHVSAIVTATRVQHLPVQERLELVHFHATRAQGWTKAMTKHKGDPPSEKRITIPRSPEDRREINEENLLKKEYEADIALEEDRKNKGRGLLGMLGIGGAGATSLSGLLALFLRYKKKVTGVLASKDRALDQYDLAMDHLPKSKRKAIGKGVDLQREHAVRRNGGEDA